MASVASPPPGQDESGLIAPAWHTALVLVLLFGIAALSAWHGGASPVGSYGGRVRLVTYASVFVWEWLTIALIAWGVRRRGHGISGLVGGSWPTGTAVLRDIGVAVLFLIGSGVILGAIQLALKNRPNEAVRGLLPQTPLETALWILLAATAGFCEETIFRGYLQQQLGRITQSVTAGLLLQAAVFGACHGYQGAKSILTITIYGGMFGLLARRRRSLRPGMIAHFLQDGVGGLVIREVLKRFPAG
jgi:membrane protease YdiL (CAAX protease family)